MPTSNINKDTRRKLVGQYTASKDVFDDVAGPEDYDPLAQRQKAKTIYDRESDYHRKKYDRAAEVMEEASEKSIQSIMELREVEREEKRVQQEIERRLQENQSTTDGRLDSIEDPSKTPPMGSYDDHENNEEDGSKTPPIKAEPQAISALSAAEPTPKKRSRWDIEPSSDSVTHDRKPSRWDQPPAEIKAESGKDDILNPRPKRSRWDQPPPDTAAASTATTTEEVKPPRSKWDVAEPTEKAAVSDSKVPLKKFAISDELLDRLLPAEGYSIVQPPANYVPIRSSAHKLMDTPDQENEGYSIPEDNPHIANSLMPKVPSSIPGVGELQYFKESDLAYFGKLVEEQDEKGLTSEEQKQRRVMQLLLKIKNGVPAVRKVAMRQITVEARTLGVQNLFNQILPLLMEQTLEDQERYLLVKVIDRILYKLGDLIRPFTHRILVVIEPLLIEEDPYARAIGREIISNLSKAAGLPHMIAILRPDIDHSDEYVRNTTARTFAVVAAALGVPKLLPFLRAVCKSVKSWEARHTGSRIIQHIAILMGCGVLPHLKPLVECAGRGLTDEQPKVRTISALALASLAEAASPFGIESFEDVLEPLWIGVRRHRGRTLANFLKCIGCIVLLMDEEYANYYTREVMGIILREFNSPDEDMKKVVLKVVQQCSVTDGVTPQYLRTEVLPSFFKSFWVRRMALDKRTSRLVVDTTVELANKVGVSEIVSHLVICMKDESEAFRRMSVDAVERILSNLGGFDIADRLEEQLIDSILVAFQEQTIEDAVILKGFGTIVNALGHRAGPYIPQIVSTILYRLNNQSPTVRKQAADLIAKIAVVMKQCDQDTLMGKLGNILYEQLGEEYPEVLGSIIGALGSIVAVVGLNSMKPPISDLLPRMTPILRNRHEKVQENAIELVGRIADRGAEFVSAREWMRICFELLDMLKARKKSIRKAANSTFGFIAKAIGPQDVLTTLLSNLRVQERQSRVCTAVAIGIVAETCAPFTVLPAIMNEYRVPDMNVQNGVLKSLTFMFEYIGDMAKDYIYSVAPMVEDAMTDRDTVHRQTGANVIRHLALGCMGLGYEDVMIHFLNLLMPNIYETSPHVIARILDAIDTVRNAVGMGVFMNYILAGLFHPARKVRTPYWRLYNSAYVQSADAMVPYYPALKEEEYHIDELDVWI